MINKILILVILTLNIAFSQNLNIEHQDLVQTFITSVKNDKVEELSKLISYPLRREYPLSDIKNATEFINRFDEIFDKDLKERITLSNIDEDWSKVGWRGIMLNQGTLWIDTNGKITAINYQSKFEKKLRTQLIKKDKRLVHESISEFEEPILFMKTNKFQIRIDKLTENNFRYSFWKVGVSLSEKPDLVLEEGTWMQDGSGGNNHYDFVNGEYVYQCYINVIGPEDMSPMDLIVLKNGIELLNSPGQIIRK